MNGLHWNADALRSQLEPRLPGLSVEIVAQTASTNTDLLERVRLAANASGAPFAPCLLVTEQQTGGRGRQGRPWLSERGASLTFSLALPLAASDWSGLSLAVGVALAEALDPGAAAPKVALKWPNDLWLLGPEPTGRKLGGVLIETLPCGRGRVAVIGVGLNVRPIAPRAELASGYACCQEFAPAASAPAVLAQVALPLADALVRFERDGFAAFHTRFAARDLLFGRPLATTGPDALEGVGAGVTAQGSLRVCLPDGTVAAVSSGEVSVRLVGAAPDVPTLRRASRRAAA